MAQDLRELLRQKREKDRFPMKEGHEARFLKLLDKELPRTKGHSFFWLKIAASLLVLISIGAYMLNKGGNDAIPTPTTVVDKGNTERSDFSLGDLSPDLKKVENYYVTNINIELSKLELSYENKDMVDSFMERLEELNDAYEILNLELNDIGPNDQTISALIKNLQLRLQLLQKLKSELNQLKKSKNEQIETSTI
ncbi:hypothetical protein GGR42_002881 [Saonia flava]|uniref:Uncharacterized protein n=1 Tax=Saonia flava TaxID=523696 RepID=A0A846QZP7_9FLAO|nr:hypothetical protein [Saonia flava]NJB72390.1 hypothetical protein [Saonia flava]